MPDGIENEDKITIIKLLSSILRYKYDTPRLWFELAMSLNTYKLHCAVIPLRKR